MNIDWSKAPEGFPLWLEGTNEEHRKHSGWYRDAGQVFEGAYGGQWRACREGQFFAVHRNPGQSIWTGEGLPPVGTVCWYGDLNEELRIITHVDQGEQNGSARYLAVGQNGEMGSLRLATAEYWHPIRTPEQIAAEEHKKEVLALMEMMRDCGTMEAAERILEAGYRKDVAP